MEKIRKTLYEPIASICKSVFSGGWHHRLIELGLTFGGTLIKFENLTKAVMGRNDEPCFLFLFISHALSSCNLCTSVYQRELCDWTMTELFNTTIPKWLLPLIPACIHCRWQKKHDFILDQTQVMFPCFMHWWLMTIFFNKLIHCGNNTKLIPRLAIKHLSSNLHEGLLISLVISFKVNNVVGRRQNSRIRQGNI